MDRLERQLRESSEQTRHFEPPAGQWDTIKDRLAQPEVGAASSDSTAATGSSAGRSLLNWSSGLLTVGFISLGLVSWFLLSPTAAESNDEPVANQRQVDTEPLASNNATLASPSIAIQPTNPTTSAAEAAPTAASLTDGIQEERQTAASTYPSAALTTDGANSSTSGSSFQAIDDNRPTDAPPESDVASSTTAQQADQAFNDIDNSAIAPRSATTPITVGGESLSSASNPSLDITTKGEADASVSNLSRPANDFAALPLLVPRESFSGFPEAVSLQSQLDNLTPGLMAIPIADYQDSGFKHKQLYRSFRRTDASPRWEGSIHIASFPLGDYSSSSLYSNQFIDGTSTLNTIFNGDPVILYRVNSNDVGQQNTTWFSSVHIDLSRRFRNGFRIGAGLGYYGTDLFRSGLNDNSFGAPDETVFVRYGSDQGSVYMADITAEYLFLRRHRFRFSLGISSLIPLVLTDRYNDRIVQPATGIEEELSSVSYTYDFIGDTPPLLFPQIGFEYQLGKRTTLSLSAGVRFGFGLRYNWLSGAIGE